VSAGQGMEIVLPPADDITAFLGSIESSPRVTWSL
jgi:hypothetical protein